MSKLWLVNYKIEHRKCWSELTKDFNVVIHMWPLDITKPGVRRLRLLIAGSLDETRSFMFKLGEHPDVTDFGTVIEGEQQTELYVYVKDSGHLESKYFDYDILFTENAPCIIRNGIEEWTILLNKPNEIELLRSKLSKISRVLGVKLIKTIQTN